MQIIELLYLVGKFLVNIFQKFFDYDSESESSRTKSSEEEEDTEDSKLKNYYFIYIFILKSNEEQETEQLDIDMAVAKEYIEYYTDKYNKLIKKHKYTMPLCKHIDKSESNNVIETTSNITAGYYITSECIKDVEKFAQKMHKNLVTKMVLSLIIKFLLSFSCIILNIF